jgi:hypothetical protein
MALSALDPNAIPDEVHVRFEADVADVKRVLARYPLEEAIAGLVETRNHISPGGTAETHCPR